MDVRLSEVQAAISTGKALAWNWLIVQYGEGWGNVCLMCWNLQAGWQLSDGRQSRQGCVNGECLDVTKEQGALGVIGLIFLHPRIPCSLLHTGWCKYKRVKSEKECSTTTHCTLCIRLLKSSVLSKYLDLLVIFWHIACFCRNFVVHFTCQCLCSSTWCMPGILTIMMSLSVLHALGSYNFLILYADTRSLIYFLSCHVLLYGCQIVRGSGGNQHRKSSGLKLNNCSTWGGVGWGNKCVRCWNLQAG